MDTIKNKKGQVAVEFIMMFVLCVSVIVYIFYFCFSLASLEYKTYVEFMVGRAITSSSPKYTDKKIRAEQVLGQFNTTDSHYGSSTVTGPLQCEFGDPASGYRGVMDYGTSGVDYDVVSNAVMACSLPMPYILPSIITRKAGNTFNVAIESMTSSEMSEDHCRCALDLLKTWKQCLDETFTGGVYVDNGC